MKIEKSVNYSPVTQYWWLRIRDGNRISSESTQGGWLSADALKCH